MTFNNPIFVFRFRNAAYSFNSNTHSTNKNNIEPVLIELFKVIGVQHQLPIVLVQLYCVKNYQELVNLPTHVNLKLLISYYPINPHQSHMKIVFTFM